MEILMRRTAARVEQGDLFKFYACSTVTCCLGPIGSRGRIIWKVGMSFITYAISHINLLSSWYNLKAGVRRSFNNYDCSATAYHEGGTVVQLETQPAVKEPEGSTRNWRPATSSSEYISLPTRLDISPTFRWCSLGRRSKVTLKKSLCYTALVWCYITYAI